jgi:hypothetical protein
MRNIYRTGTVTNEILQILCMSFSDKCFVNVIMPQIYSLIREHYYLVSKLTLNVVICLSTKADLIKRDYILRIISRPFTNLLDLIFVAYVG